MQDRSAPLARSATSAGIAFTITDLEVAGAVLKLALASSDAAFRQRTYNHTLRTLQETHELLARASPAASEKARLDELIAVIQARLAAYRARYG